MDQTTYVINALDDSKCRSIGYLNRIWLRKNVEKMNLRVCVEDCEVDADNIEASWKDEDQTVIQNGEKVSYPSHFYYGEEALLIIKYPEYNMVYLYSPN